MIVARKVFINRTSDEVFGYTAAAGAEPEWRRSVLHSSLDEPGLLRAGSRGRSLIRFMGREVEATWEIVEYAAGARLCRRYSSPVRGGRDSYRFEAFGRGASVLEMEVEVQAAGLAGLLAAVTRTAADRELRADLERLKRILESR